MSLIEYFDDDTVTERRNMLLSALYDLSDFYMEEEKDLESFARRMSLVYEGGYRHVYSDLYPALMAIHDGDPSDLDVLCTNLDTLYRHVGSHWNEKDSELYGHLLKLSDHVNLEVQRMAETDLLKQQLEELYNQTNEAMEESQKLERRLKKAVKRSKTLQLELVSILAIFAAIVVAFSGGMNVLGGALSGLADAGRGDTAFIVILCGIVLFNTVAFLLHAVMWIIHRTDDDDAGRSSFLDWGYVVAFNVVLFALLALVILSM